MERDTWLYVLMLWVADICWIAISIGSNLYKADYGGLLLNLATFLLGLSGLAFACWNINRSS